MKKIFFVFGFIILSAAMNAQVWYFGNHAGIDFSSSMPVSVSNGQQMNTGEGCTMAYDNNCNLLFYTDGVTVWDENNVVVNDVNSQPVTLANGLWGSPTSTQSAIAVPAPGKNYDEFWIFTLDKGDDIRGFRYSYVTSCLTTPVVTTTKNILLSPVNGRMSEKLSVIRNLNGDYWILIHGFSAGLSDLGCNFYAYQLDNTNNLNTVPVISTVGSKHEGYLANTQGQMKFSHDGMRVAVAIGKDRRVEVFDFSAGGALTNPRRIQFPRTVYSGNCNDCELYGLEFSPNNQYLFISGTYECGCDNAKHRIYQVDLNSFLFNNTVLNQCGGGSIQERLFHNVGEIQSAAGITIIHESSASWNFGAMQLGPDNRIYVARTNGTLGPVVSRIENPDNFGATFTEMAITLDQGQDCIYGFPTLLQNNYSCRSEIHGSKFNDRNGNGIWETGQGENGLGGWVINLIGNTSGINRTYTTGANGAYEFTKLPSDVYSVFETQQAGWKQTFPAGTHLINLQPSTISFALDFGNCRGFEPPQGMVAWWPMDETYGTTAEDVMGFDNTGSYNGSPTQDPAGQVAGCLWFNVVNNYFPINYLEASDQTELNFGTGDFSIDAWVQGTDYQGQNYNKYMIVSKKSVAGSSVTGYSFYIDNLNRLALEMGNGAMSFIYYSNVTQFLIDGTHWYHVAVTVDRDNSTDGIKFYIDGVVHGTADPTNQTGDLTNSANLRIACASDNQTNLFYGRLDEIEMFNRKLEGTEIAGIFNAGTCGKHKPYGSVCGFKFNDLNGDGAYTPGEPKLPGWTIQLSGDDTQQTTTDANGNYCFNHLWPGNYTVSEVSQGTWTQTCPAAPGTYNIVLADAQSVPGINFGNRMCVPPPPDMNNWWHLDEKTGSISDDISGYDNAGSYVGIPVNPTQQHQGKVKGSLWFSNMSQYVNVPAHPEVNFGTGDFSFDAWIYFVQYKTFSANAIILDKIQGGNQGYCFYVDNGVLALKLGDGTGTPGTYLSGVSMQSSGQWAHVAVTVDRNIPDGIVFYYNGVAYPAGDPTTHQGPVTNTLPLKIGGTDISGGWEGLDEIETFTRVLTPQEIMGLYNAGSNGKCKPPMVIIGNVGNLQCPGIHTGSISTVVHGGIAEYTYLWSNGSTSSAISSLAAGTYSVTVTDAYGMVAEASFTVNQPALMALLTDVTPATCTGVSDGAIDLTVTGGILPYTYQWSNGPQTEDISGLPAGTYTVTVTGSSGCSQTATRVITVNPFLSGSICGYKFNDMNGDGIFDGDETTLSGWTISINTIPVTTTTTDANGAYCFNGVCPGTYQVSEVSQPLWTQTCPSAPRFHVVDLVAGQSVPGVDFGNRPCVTPPIGMTNWWALDETTGTIATDLKETNNQGTYVGNPQQMPGKVAWSLKFLNMSQYVTVPDNDEVDIGAENFSFDAWIMLQQTNSLAGDAIILDKFQGLNVGYSFYVHDGMLALRIGDAGGTATYYSIGTLSAGQWNHVAVTVDRNSTAGVVFYINGAPSPGGNPMLHNQSLFNLLPLRIGGSGIASCWEQLDEIEMFPRVLNAQEIFDIYNSDIHGKCKATGKITGFKFNDVNDNQLYDNPPDFKIPGWQILLSGDKTEVVFTDAAGNYSFDNLMPGHYTVSEEVREPECVQTFPPLPGEYYVELNNGQTETARIFGNHCTPGGIVIDSNVTALLCNAVPTGIIHINVTGGLSPYDFSWSNGQSTATIDSLPAGPYSVTVTDMLGSTATGTYIVTEPPALVLSSTIIAAVCSGSSGGAIHAIVSGGVPPYIYTWSDGTITFTTSSGMLDGLSGGTYTITVSDANGCMASTSQYLPSNPLPVVFSGTGGGSYCEGGPGVPVGLSGSETGVMYTLLHGANQVGSPVMGTGGPISFGLQTLAGIYSVIGEYPGTGCSAVMDTLPPIDPDPYLIVSVAISASSNPVCQGMPVTYAATAVNGGITPFYEWFVNGISSQNGINPAFIYTPANYDIITCVMTSDETCTIGNPATSNSVSMLVANPQVEATTSGTRCGYGSVTLSAFGSPGATLTWYATPIGGTVLGTGSIFDTPAIAVTTTFYVSAAYAGCESSRVPTVAFVTPADAIYATATPSVICAGQSSVLNVTQSGSNNSYTYTWTDGTACINGQSVSVTPQATTMYTVTGTDGSCVATASVVVTVNPTLIVSVYISASANPVMAGTPVTLMATVVPVGLNSSYQWMKNGISISGATTVNYTYVPENNDMLACMITFTENCVSGNPVVSNTVTMTVLPAMTLSFNMVPECTYNFISVSVAGGNPPYQYTWSNGATTYYQYLTAGTYTVSVTDANNVTVASPCTVVTLDCDFGDAKEPLYHTYHGSNGPRHAISGLKLGMFIDTETDGQQSLFADGDDTNGTIPDDEDGINGPGSGAFTQVSTGTNMLLFTTYNNLSQTAYLQGWIDFDGDGIMDPGEQIITNQPIPQGPFSGNIVFTVPPLSNPLFSIARFRLSTTYNLSFTGLAPDGEVEDYYIYIDNVPTPTLDYGDAPDNGNFQYNTLNVNDGARHFSDCHVRLGTLTDAEPDGLQTIMANGDGSDEDGVVFPSSFSATNNIITIYPHNDLLNGTVYLNGWMDFNQDGIWGNSPNEHFLVEYQIPYSGATCCYDPLHPGWLLNVPVPLPLMASGCMYARFRISDTPGVGPSQPSGIPVTIGEVEDYRVCLNSCPAACESFDDGTSNFMTSNDGAVSNGNLVITTPGSGGYTGDKGLKVTDISGSTWIYNNSTDYSGNYLLCDNNCLCWDINMLENDQSYYPSIFIFRGFNTSLPVGPSNPQYMARFTSSSLIGLDRWAHTCARIQPSAGNDPPLSQEGTWTWNNYPGSNPPDWNNFISDIGGIMFRVDVTGWGGEESFILDSICLSPCVTDTVTLTVNSLPCSNVNINATPMDIHGNGSGTTLFTRDYIQGAIVYLTAPQTMTCGNDQYCFKQWIVNGLSFMPVTDNPIKVKMNSDKNYTALYCRKNKTILVQAMIGSDPGPALTGVPITYSPTLGSDPNGLVLNPFGTSPAPVPFTGTYYYPSCNMTPVVYTLAAPLTYNNHHFLWWHVIRTDCYGNTVSLIPTGSNVISYPLDNDYICTAIYDNCCLATVTNAGANCCDGSIDFSAPCGTPPYTYMWSNTATTQDISGLCPGTYCVTVTDGYNVDYECCWDVGQNKSACQSTYIQNHVVENGRDTCFDALQTIYVAGNGTNFTVLNGGSSTLIAGQKISFMPGTKVFPGGYLHAYIAPAGPWCGTKSTAFVEIAEETTEITAGSGKSFFSLFPNPTTGAFTLELKGLEETAELRVEMYGIYGERLTSTELKGRKKYELSLEDKPAGIYFVRVVSGKYAGTGKIIKQ